ncbi:sodium:calcium antiporter [Candidatus Laterigemmans baculatus]|uniref:sodium:calcium antiporter n=1 Tax=Candidatus Laterigemmans baculatus TaxID=2770505 RepID=UPI001F35E674|nr:sodium:calcium antiporter [Candidatus Laterigemmans baculatus]
MNFAELSVWLNCLLFAVTAIGVWWAGSKLSIYVDLIAERTGLGRAFAGALLLGGATSLPEIATTVTASASGAATLAGTNLVGGIAMQIVVLAVLDAVVLRRKALTFFSPQAALLMQAAMLIQLLGWFIAANSSGEFFTFAHIGLWPVLLFAAYLLALWVIYRYEDRSRWEPAGEVGQPPESARDLKDVHDQAYAEVSTKQVGIYFGMAALVVLGCGYLVARLGETLAAQTGIGQGIVGATLVALVTSLPEVSTTWSAFRFGAYNMATANILGTNCLTLALFLPADLAYRKGPIIDALGPSASFLAALGIMTTSIYLWGVLERRDRTVFGMGIDSAVVLVLYVVGLVIYASISQS